MKITRRRWLQGAGALAVSATSIRGLGPNHLFAGDKRKKGDQPPTLVAIYLRGGADALSVFVPLKEKKYSEWRPTLAVSSPDSGGASAALALDEQFGFNPHLKELHALYRERTCAGIVCVGSPHPTRSHFDAQDFMERAAPGQRNVTTGWLNRYLQQTASSNDSSLRAFALQPLLPRSVRGDYPVLAVPERPAGPALETFKKIYSNERGMRISNREAFGMENKRAIRDFGVQTIDELNDLNQLLQSSRSSSANYPQTAFGRKMADIAKVIKANKGLEVTALDYNGWDHHIDEGPLTGAMSRMLGDLSASVGAFSRDLGSRMNKVLVLIMSEFGRSVQENGNRGTDHGHGGFMIAVGGNVNGGKVYGQWKGLEKNLLYQDRDLPVTTDFRVVFAETLERHLRFDSIGEGMFPEYTRSAAPLDFLRAG